MDRRNAPLLGTFLAARLTIHISSMASNSDHSTTFNELIKLSGVWLFIHFSVVGIDIRDAILVGIS